MARVLKLTKMVILLRLLLREYAQKWPIWGWIQWCQKHTKNESRTTFEFFYYKSGWKKKLVLKRVKILKGSESFLFWIFREGGLNKFVSGNLWLREKEYPERIMCIKRRKRASYQTMCPEISARWSLWGTRFRYLLPDSRSFVTDLFHRLGSLCNKPSYVCVYIKAYQLCRVKNGLFLGWI